MEQAWIGGQPAAVDTAVAEAARLLDASRQPLIAGLGTDVAGVRATVALARRTGAVVDHMHSDAVLRDLDVMRSSGVMLTTPGEAKAHADVLLLVGPGLSQTSGGLPAGLLARTGHRRGGAAIERHVYWLCPGRDVASIAPAGTTVAAIAKDPRDLPVVLAALRAGVAGRPSGKARVSAAMLAEVSAALKLARFGVAVWSAAELDALTIEMLWGLVSELNDATRFSALPLAASDNAPGVLQTCGWLTGFPMRTGFGRGRPEHDPWLFDSRRLVESGEADCVLWISAYRAAAPPWSWPPIIALTGRGAAFQEPPRVQIEVGTPGIDHYAIEHVAALGALGAVEPTRPRSTISVADAMTRIALALPGGGERPC